MNPRELDAETKTQAIEYVLGTLPNAHRPAFEAELERSAALRAEVRSLRAVAEDLTLATPEVDAPSDLWSRIHAQTTRDREGKNDVQLWKQWDQPDASMAGMQQMAGMFLARGDDANWEATGTEGIEALQLFVDRAADRVTMLVRMAPGTSYPAHRHAGPEECYVLEGDLLVGDTPMAAGDYQRMETGSEHPVQSTRGGCLLFLQSSLGDELVA